jgi:hypothetical protein
METPDHPPARSRSSRIDELFRQGPLRDCLARIERHRRLLVAIREILPASLAAHCTDCVTDEHNLVLYADSASWAVQLRFYLPKIIRELSACGVAQLQRAKVRMLPPSPDAPSPEGRRARSPSATAIAVVEGGAAVADEEIKSALLRLARTLRKSSA